MNHALEPVLANALAEHLAHLASGMRTRCHSISRKHLFIERGTAFPQWTHDTPSGIHWSIHDITRVLIGMTVRINEEGRDKNVTFESVLLVHTGMDAPTYYGEHAADLSAPPLHANQTWRTPPTSKDIVILTLRRTSPHAHETCLTPTDQFCIFKD